MKHARVAVAIVRKPGQAMRLFECLAEQRPDLAWLVNDTKSMLAARHFVAQAVAQQGAIAEGRPALFILSPRHGETMITMEQASNNARLIQESADRIRDAMAAEISGGTP